MTIDGPDKLVEQYRSGERTFDNAHLQDANLRGVDLSNASMRLALLQGADLTDAILDGVDFSKARLMGAKFDRASLKGAFLADSNMSNASFLQANLHGASLKRALAKDVEFGEADLTRAVLTDANLTGGRLGATKLPWAMLDGAVLRNSDLSDAQLLNSDLVGVDLTGACIENLQLTAANLEGACLHSTHGLPRDRQGCRVNFLTFSRSSWSASILASWHSNGATITNLEEFPKAIRETALGRKGELEDSEVPLRIFISYRRDDVQIVASLLRKALHDDGHLVIKDVDSIPFGVDFAQYIREEVAKCDVMLALIGPRWDLKRLYSEGDYVRLELTIAWACGKPLLPVLYERSMPGRDELPEDLRKLCNLNAARIRPDPDLETDLRELLGPRGLGRLRRTT